MKVYVVAAIFGALLIAAGFGRWHLEVGMVVGGIEWIAAAYIGAYLTRQTNEAPK